MDRCSEILAELKLSLCDILERSIFSCIDIIQFDCDNSKYKVSSQIFPSDSCRAILPPLKHVLGHELQYLSQNGGCVGGGRLSSTLYEEVPTESKTDKFLVPFANKEVFLLSTTSTTG